MDTGAGVIAAPAIGWANAAGPAAVVTIVGGVAAALVNVSVNKAGKGRIVRLTYPWALGPW